MSVTLGESLYIGIVQYNVRPWLFVLFVLGVHLRKIELSHEKEIRGIAIIGGIVGTIILIKTYYLPSNVINNVNFFVMNISMVYLVCVLLKKNFQIRNNVGGRFVEFVGRYSYAFCLWHVLVLMLLQ